MKSVGAVSLVGVWLLGSICYADSTTEPSVAASSVYIVSDANVTLMFSIRPQDGEWANYSLQPGQGITISCDGCSVGSFEFLLDTEGADVDYQLQAGKRFVLQWNSGRNIWDIFEVTS